MVLKTKSRIFVPRCLDITVQDIMTEETYMNITRLTKPIIKLAAILIMTVLLLPSCDTVFDIHPYDTRITGATNINQNNIATIEKTCAGRDTVRIAFISDSHQWYNDLEAIIDDINRRDSIDFVVHLGDITDFGSTQEYLWTRKKMERLNKPYVVMQGNHDCLGTGNEAYAKMYGNNDFSFVAGRTKIVCLNTNAIEYDYSEPIPDFDFMEREAIADTTVFDRTIVCMHAAPFSEQFNNNVVKPFNYYITQFPGLLFCMYGHGHHTEEHDFFDNGVIYYEVASASKREYRIFVITPKGYSNEVVRL